MSHKYYRTIFKKYYRIFFLFIIITIAYWFCLPSQLFEAHTSMILEDEKGNLLGAHIAPDGQWRFPYHDKIPEKFEKAIIEFEDHRFYYHPGIDIIGIGRAIWQNIKNKRIVSGGSTISMQVMRMSRNSNRSLWNKLIESIQATRLEIRYSKKEILALYSSNAPFGGNVVGLQAATWRYFNKSPQFLSWSEAATLAVLPNSPALIHPGRNRSALEAKRNRLLDKLYKKGIIDSLSCSLAKTELLPEKPHVLPRLAPHLLDRVSFNLSKEKNKVKTRLVTTLDSYLQQQVTQTIKIHNAHLRSNGIHNLAAIVADIETGKVLAYVGNVSQQESNEHGHQVDIIPAPRSTGSILKPFLYTYMIQEGKILPTSLLSDVPTHVGAYRPKNYSGTYNGVVPAKTVISRSLNVPSVRMLQQYGLQKLHFNFQKLGLNHIDMPAEHYGLPLILGGAEASLWELTGIYASMARTLNHFSKHNSRYDPTDFRELHYNLDKKIISTPERGLHSGTPFMSASAIWASFDAMREVIRPNSEGNWRRYNSSKAIAWKTGTSFGFRDAWAIGVTPKYVVGVWAGNADGEGRPGLVGVKAAAPVLFDIYKLLDVDSWFEEPLDELCKIAVCKKSGYRALPICESDTLWMPNSCLKAPACQYHRLIHLDSSEQWRVNSSCVNPINMKHVTWFVLPPLEEHYYKVKNPTYSSLPPLRPDCNNLLEEGNPMQLIYPKKPTKIYIPRNLDGTHSRTVFKVAHREKQIPIYWHLDNEYIGATTDFHEMEFYPKAGNHILTLVDSEGYRLQQKFEIIER